MSVNKFKIVVTLRNKIYEGENDTLREAVMYLFMSTPKKIRAEILKDLKKGAEEILRLEI